MSLRHRQLQPLLLRAFDGFGVAGIGVAHDARAGVVPQHAGDAGVGFFRAIADDHEAGVLRVAHADAAAVMERNPGRAAGGAEQRVEQRPVGHRIAAILHRLRLAVR